MSNSANKSKKPGEIPTGIVGLILTGVFCIAIFVAPGGFVPVMFGGIVSVVGLVVSIVGAVRGSGRWAGVAGILMFFVGWGYNTWFIGRL